MFFNGSPLPFGQPADKLGDASALPGSGKTEGTFNRIGSRHDRFLAQARG
jgi:hypothetical protein